MKVKEMLMIFVAFIIYILPTAVRGNKNTTIRIGYLTIFKTARKFMIYGEGKRISGAITYAVEKINNDSSLLPNHRLEVDFYDTQEYRWKGTLGISEQWKRGVVAFFGPENTCIIEGRVAAAWNLPMFSYKCDYAEVSDKALYPTFVRTLPTEIQIIKSIISLLRHYNWRRFTIVKGSHDKNIKIAANLAHLCASYNITVNDDRVYTQPYVADWAGIGNRNNPFSKIVDETYVGTRVYVFLGDLTGLVGFMKVMNNRSLIASGEYVVICTDHETYDPEVLPYKYIKSAMDPPDAPPNLSLARALLVVAISTPSNLEYPRFLAEVRRYIHLPPFNFPRPPPMFGDHKIPVTVYATYLYDAVYLYARALDEHIREGGNVTDGAAIVERILDRPYRSIQGFMVQINEHGDAEGNYSVLAIGGVNGTMVNVGQFEMINASGQQIPLFREYDAPRIQWINGVPVDEPECGYVGEKCILPKSNTPEIVGAVLGGVTLVIGTILFMIYRHWKYEQEVAGLSWKISVDEIKRPEAAWVARRSGSFSSNITSISGRTSASRISSAQMYTKTGTYNGRLVALKVYERKNIDVTRSTKKQMKIMRDLRHDNVNAFLGVCLDVSYFTIVTEYCAKGSLQDILVNDDVKLDDMFIASLVKDLIQGLIFLHHSQLVCHGNLKSSNCIVNCRWALQVTDFGLLDVRTTTYDPNDEYPYFRNFLWTAPELLRQNTMQGSRPGDVYAFGIILHEIFWRQGPFSTWTTNTAPKDIVTKVREGVGILLRPDTDVYDIPDYVRSVMHSCWEEDPEKRPDLQRIWNSLKPLRHGMKSNIFDNMLAMMEKYQSNLELLVEERTTQLVEEKQKTENLLYRMIPRSVAEDLKRGQPVVPEAFQCVTIYFSDICGFTALSASSTPLEVVNLLNDLYTLFDSTIANYGVYKVETIGDAYMVVSGLPIRNGDYHAGEIASMSLHLLRQIKTFRIKHRPEETLKLRIGIHSGPCVAGVVGHTMPRYCLFGDTVNTASRMESNGMPLKVHCSKTTVDLLVKLGGYTTETRGTVEMKGKGELITYWLLDEDFAVRQTRMSNANILQRNDKSQGSLTKRPNRLDSKARNGSRQYLFSRSSPLSKGSSRNSLRAKSNNERQPHDKKISRKNSLRENSLDCTYESLLDDNLNSNIENNTNLELCPLAQDNSYCLNDINRGTGICVL